MPLHQIETLPSGRSRGEARGALQQMKLSIRDRSFSTAVVILGAVVVTVLAVLQYRWSNQVSEATSVRLADSLQMSMINWHLDLFRDLSEIGLAMRMDPDSRYPDELEEYARHFAEWRSQAKYPGLVSNLYILKSMESEPLQALRLNPSSRQFEADAWPARFQALREHLQSAQRRSVSEATSQTFAEGFFSLGNPLVGWRFEPSIPALFHPIDSREQARERSQPGDWVAIELNRTVIETQILPELAQAYFRGTDGLDFDVAVVSGNQPGNVIYSSDPGFGEQEIADADGIMNIFGHVQDRVLGSPIHVFHRPSENTGPAAFGGISWFPLLQEGAEDQDWKLVVRHRRGGPLGAFVVEMRRRDLAISFGALFLLVISMAMVIIAGNRAQRLAKLQVDFVTAVSHELRTPLTVIGSAADNIADGVVGGKQQLAQYGTVIRNQARQLSGLVEQILLFAATGQGRQRYDLRLLQIPEIIEAALASTRELIQAAQFTVEREIAPDLPAVRGDRSALSQCLQNLITNAVKYGSDQRWLGIRARVFETGMSGREVQISVSDRGMGISPADLPHIFEPFYRSPSVAAAQVHGTGLGLPLAQSIARAMKGKITVTSQHGRGSTFTLHLPGAVETVPKAAAEAKAAGVSQ
ncbi:MAG: sensor histidine kinase [Terriglobia bacterium]